MLEMPRRWAGFAVTDRPAIISAATVSCKTMADDTLRVSFDIEPADAQIAFQLFGRRGTAVAIAALTDDAAKTDMQSRVTKATHPYGQFARDLMARGFFNSPRVQQALNSPGDPTATKAALKADLGYDSLGEIPPWAIKRWAAEHAVVFTFPEIET
jgi:hypothetical protein